MGGAVAPHPAAHASHVAFPKLRWREAGEDERAGGPRDHSPPWDGWDKWDGWGKWDVS